MGAPGFQALEQSTGSRACWPEEQGQVVGVSAISLRELAKMIQGRRIEVDAPLESRLGDDFHRDPADRIIVATARCHDLTLITADERVRRWGKVRVV